MSDKISIPKQITAPTQDQIKAKVTAIEKIYQGADTPVTINVSVTLEGKAAKFYRVLFELVDIVGMSKEDVMQSVVEDGVTEFFKKLWTVFSLTFARLQGSFEGTETKTKN